MTQAMKVLIVSKNEQTRQTLKELFQKRGYLMESVGTGKEALEAIQRIPFNFMLIDSYLPDMKGLDLLEEVRKINFQVNCILITDKQEEDSESSFTKGAKVHLVKPLRMEDVFRIFGEDKLKNHRNL